MKSEKFRKRKYIAVSVLLTAMFLVSCGEKKEPLTAEDDAQKVLKAANDQYAREEFRGNHGVYTYIYMDGSSEEETVDVSFDVKKGIEQLVYSGEDSGEMMHYNVKEKDGYYSYVLDPETNAWVRYMQEPDEDGKTTYEIQEEGITYLFDEESGYANVNYSNEGKEKLDGKDAIKIKVTGESANNSEESDTVTRESILKEYELTEEAIGYIDGLSDALDQYVASMNASENAAPMTFETDIWVEADTHRPLRNQTIWDMENMSTSQSAADMQGFEDNIWKAYSLMSDLEEGLSVEKALENIKKNEPEMEAEIQAEKEMMEGDMEGILDDDAMLQKQMISTIEYFYGEDCREIEELPEYYTEITQEEYYSGEY